MIIFVNALLFGMMTAAVYQTEILFVLRFIQRRQRPRDHLDRTHGVKVKTINLVKRLRKE